MCQHLRRRHLAPGSLTLRLQFSEPGLYLIRHRRIEQVPHNSNASLDEDNQEPVWEGSFFCSSPIEYPIGAVSQTTLYETCCTRARQSSPNGWVSAEPSARDAVLTR